MYEGTASSIAIDGPNDIGLEKMNLVTVQLFDLHDDKVAARFLDMCLSGSFTVSGIYTILNERKVALSALGNLWGLCTTVGVDNTSVNIEV